ncbi:MAG TPA: immunity 53 family protein [Chthoniobacteraceae bacterium]|jgi:hypothetical protein|nr:immunity 53 family protein [Phycisphaerae bacterium]HWB57857.1 immunity 53 family protein [Chthoniobacteraceae bacterium]
MPSVLERIQQWYADQCDGEWEHDFGVRIESLDNPGWLLRINLAGTALESRPFATLAEGLEEDEGAGHPTSITWHSISVKGNVFEAAGDPSKLEFFLRTFLDWAKQQAPVVKSDWPF